MKRLIFIFLTSTLFLTCEKPEREILIETGIIEAISSTSITVTGNIIDIGEGIATYGHMAATDNAFTVNVKKSSLSSPARS